MTKEPTSSAMTNAERQAAFRARKAEAGDGVFYSLVAHPTVAQGMRRLARHYGKSQAEVLLRMVHDAENKALKGMTPAAEKEYYGD